MKKHLAAVFLALFLSISASGPAPAAEDYNKNFPGDWRDQPQSAITEMLVQERAYTGYYRYKIHKFDRHFFLVESQGKLYQISVRRKTIEQVE